MRRFMVCSVALLLLASGCGGGPGRSEGKLEVVASFYPLAFIARSISGPHVVLRNLTPAGAEPHDLELTPGAVGRVHEADLVVYLSGGFQPTIEDVVEGAREVLDVREAAHITGSDPHFWLDPRRLETVVAAIRDALASIDGTNVASYHGQAARLAERLRLLDTEFQQGLRSCERREIVTSHEAFGYLAQRYDLKQVAIAGIDPESEPTPGRIAEVVRTVRRLRVRTIFTETLVSPKIAETLARETGAKIAVLDPLEGVRSGSGDDYFSVMRRNLETLQRALACTT